MDQKEKQKLVKIKTLRPICINRKPDQHGMIQGDLVPEGVEVEVSQEDAALFCDTKFKTLFSFQGERYAPKGKVVDERYEVVRAVRV